VSRAVAAIAVPYIYFILTFPPELCIPRRHPHSITFYIYFTMLTAQQANDSLCLVAEKIGRLTKRAQKLGENDPARKGLAHEIALTLVSVINLYLVPVDC
jgi:hypothetical protein